MIPKPLLSRVVFLGTQYFRTSNLIKGFFKERYSCVNNSKLFPVSSVNGNAKYCTDKIKENKKKMSEMIEVWRNITVQEMAELLKTDIDTIISLVPESEQYFDIKPTTPIESTQLITNLAKKFNKKCKIIAPPHLKKEKISKVVSSKQPPSKPENLIKRPPVVTVMGHVDHGKTTLLDSLRNTFVVEQEFGGITQHIGAFSVDVKSGEKITFIDTPGHAAFTKMRARGAQVTDLVVLVIAADDGVMEQTVESIRIIKRAGVRLVVAVNKIDKPTALKIDEIKEKLLYEGIQVEDKGGSVQFVPISALKKINLDLLVEVILLEADLMDLKGDPTGLVEGVVIESKLDKRGKLATVLIKRGTLKKGKIIVAGKAHAKVRLMLDENSNEYKEALPSTPVQILGWKELPAAGDEVFEVSSEKQALSLIKQEELKEMAKKQEEDEKFIKIKAQAHKEIYNEDREKMKSFSSVREKRTFYFEKYRRTSTDEDTGPLINLILKGDVDGSLEVLTDVLNTYEQEDECKLRVIEASVGNITPNDIELAEASKGIIYAFNVKLQPDLESLVQEKEIDIRHHNIIYKFIDDLKAELNSKILPIDVEEIKGEAEVLQNFSINVNKKKVPVAGCKCTSGKLEKNALFKVIRGDEIIHQGPLISMKHLKNEVKTIEKLKECGLMFESFKGEFKPGDKIICYSMVKKAVTTSWDPGF